MKQVNKFRIAILFGLLCTTFGLSFALPQGAHAATTSAVAPASALAPQASASPAKVKKIIDQVFGPRYAPAAKRVAYCESRFNPKAYNPQSGAAGVFQFLLSTWKTTSQRHHSRFEARANIVAAHEVFVRDGYSWREWQCKP